MQLTCSHYVPNMFQTCFQHKCNHFLVLPFYIWYKLDFPRVSSLYHHLLSWYHPLLICFSPLLIDPQTNHIFISIYLQAPPTCFQPTSTYIEHDFILSYGQLALKYQLEAWRWLCRDMCRSISAHVDGGLSGESSVRRNRSKDPHRHERNSL